jgi:hypothetical protein
METRTLGRTEGGSILSILDEFGEHECQVCGTDCITVEEQIAEKDATIATLKAKLAACEWISVDERLPDGTQNVIVFCGRPIVGWFDSKGNLWRHNNNLIIMTNPVTHWMPLPNPPQQEREP